MAVYKVIQDIESEDKLLGPLTLKGLVYAAIAFLSAFIEFKLLFIGTPLKWLFILMFAVPMILFGVLASPLGREQPTEVWLLSRIRYFLKPRKRIWDQEGLSQFVTITAPKKIEAVLTKNLSQTEVQSRLKTLATTLDTRGWAIKNVDVNLSVPEVQANNSALESDRLVGAAGMPQQMPVADVHASDDIMDEKNNPTAHKFDTMMKHAEAERKRDLISSLKGLVVDGDDKKKKHVRKRRAVHTKDLPATKAALESMVKRQAESLVRRKAKEEAEVEAKLSKARAKFAKEFDRGQKKSDPAHKVVGPLEPAGSKTAPASPVTPKAQTVNMELAQSGSAFSVATLSQLANRTQVKQTGPDEVTISLHPN